MGKPRTRRRPVFDPVVTTAPLFWVDGPVPEGAISPKPQACPFVVSVVGLSVKDLSKTPGGAWPIRSALPPALAEKVVGSFFHLSERRR